MFRKRPAPPSRPAAPREAESRTREQPSSYHDSSLDLAGGLDVLAEAIVKGDDKVPAISAASILAKVHRDRWCARYDEQFPQYGFAAHKGYGTAAHLAALREHGACPEHRRSFSPVAEVLALQIFHVRWSRRRG